MSASYSSPDEHSAPCPPDEHSAPRSLEGPASRTLWYRYWLFGWIFEDCSQGNVFENAAALRRNRAKANLLTIYIRRYAATAGLSLGAYTLLGDAAPLAWQLLLISPLLACVPLLVVSASIWSALHLFEH